MIGAEGAPIPFSVISLSDAGWSVTSEAPWITFSLGGVDSGSFDPVATVATIAPNASGKERDATILFRSKDIGSQPMEVKVTQMGYHTTFAATRVDAQGYVSEIGGSLRYDLDTSFDWEVKAPVQ